jgi:hypothetical protein
MAGAPRSYFEIVNTPGTQVVPGLRFSAFARQLVRPIHEVTGDLEMVQVQGGA